MIIHLKNKHTLKVDEFYFKCSIGKNGLSLKKKEGDKKTPKGTFEIENLYFREDKKYEIKTSLKSIKINKNMAWSDDINYPDKYNKLIKIPTKIRHEKLSRKDYKYNLLIPIKYNFNKPKKGLGSCIFIYLTKNYKPTEGCLALKEKDFLIMLKIIKKNTKIKIS